MKLVQRTVGLLLSEDAEAVESFAGFRGSSPVYVQEADDMGLRVRAMRADGEHLVLVRWDYVVSVDVSARNEEIGIKV